jgi:hypothetical protein
MALQAADPPVVVWLANQAYLDFKHSRKSQAKADLSLAMLSSPYADGRNPKQIPVTGDHRHHRSSYE